ncbi:PTS sugar transporter subunit IIC [Erysipelothrix sp. HDW6A]|uniref:PTS sugar transporter subunit IIC n=1 Tax=Erysipelothrix sp. HDW6A TaxID=2714928 RepID=UPI0014079171|nr:PTS transporter subunit EIIC [Erysipelothrix sp. HDW6A]QIK57090.1 PTS sugar transporter subunit IIC [Erysipelothrix sp. HDW6A]
MQKLSNYIETHFAPIFAKLGSNPYVNGVKNGMIATSPFTIIGSIFIIIQQFPVKAWTEFMAPYASMFNVPNMMTIGIIALYVVFGVGYNLGKSLDLEPLSIGLLSLMAFMILQIDRTDFTMSSAYFGSKGIFPALVVSIFVAKTVLVFEKHGLIIKFPPGVPDAVSKAFASLYPAMFVAFVMFTISVLLKIDIQEIIITMFSPLVFALNTLPGILIFQLMIHLLWSAGIHGASIMNTVGRPIFLSYLAANTEAALAGNSIPYITAQGFTQMFISIGGAGATLGLILVMLRSKDEGFRQLAKLSLPAGIFNINEPIIFGFPIVMNPTMMIPFILTITVNTILSYGMMYFNIIGRPIIDVPWIMPAPIAAYLMTGGDVLAAVWSVAIIALSAAIYYPFLRIAEKERKAEINQRVE